MNRVILALFLTVSMLSMALVFQACGDDDDDDAADSGDDDNSGGRVTDSDISIELTCVDSVTEDDGTDDVPFTDAVHVTSVYTCTYWRDAQEIGITLREDEGEGDGYIGVGLIDFSGPGSFTTGATINDNLVEMAGSVGEYDSAGVTEGDDDPLETCQIEVDTNLHEVDIPEGGSSTGWIEVSVTCPKIGNPGIGIIECELAPEKWSFVVSDCEAGL